MNDNGKGKATASLVLGIISLVICWLGMGALAAIITGIFGIVLSVQANKEMAAAGVYDNKAMATIGLVLSIIGLVIGGVVFVACGLVVGAVSCIGCAAVM
ncbi:MAG TPA: hypothetical protein GXZ65_00330 [Clostridiales bacterium]|nr:hypothetical protein [Clostridiales bacterium]